MSSLAAARADNFYYGPDFDPKNGGINKQQGQHPLRERAKKLDQGILVIRFEMSFNVWCAGCGHLIGKGVRFNAEKQAIGAYHTTKIWSFSMTAPCCAQRIVVHTDPKSSEYLIASGGKRKAEAFTPEDAQTLRLPDAQERAQLQDPLARLENGERDKAVARGEAVRMSHLRELNNERYKDDYAANKALRRRLRGSMHIQSLAQQHARHMLDLGSWADQLHRVARKDDQGREVQRKALGLPEDVRLLPAAPGDAAAASLVVFGDPHAHHRNWQKHRKAIQKQDIFAGAGQHLQLQPHSGSSKGVKRKSISDLAARHRQQRKLESKSVMA